MTQKVPIAMKMLLNQHAVIGGGNKSSAHQYTHTHAPQQIFTLKQTICIIL